MSTFTTPISVELSASTDLDPRIEFGRVYETYYQTVYRAVRSVVVDAALAEDVVQDSFVKAYRARDRYRPAGRLEQWLCTIAVREALTRTKWLALQERVRRLALRSDPAPRPPETLYDIVDEALGTLTPKTRAALVLFYYHGFRYREIAEILGVPEGTAASRIADGMRRMRAHFGQTDGSGGGIG